MRKSKIIYLDNAAATPIDSRVFSVMTKILKEDYANPSAIHDLGVKNKKILEKSREDVAEILGAHSNEIIFTSGATESNNLVILGVVEKYSQIFFPCALLGVPGGTLADKKFVSTFLAPHIVTTNIEHSSVLETCKYLEKNKKAEVTYVPVEANGIVDPKKIKKAIKENTVLVSVMYANNEIGTIQPIREIAKEIRHFRKMNVTKDSPSQNEGLSFVKYPLFHTDATQAVNYLPIGIPQLGVDLMSFNGGKIYGPKGVGVLYIKRKTPINEIIHGGEQEFGLRAGTENISSVVGLVEALKITQKIKEKEIKRLSSLSNYFIEELKKVFSNILVSELIVNGDLKNRLPNNVNIGISKIPSDLLVLELSARGIYVSEKSACQSGEKAGSYVIAAINHSARKICKRNEGSLRFSLGRETKKEDLIYVLKSLSEILEKLKKWYY